MICSPEGDHLVAVGVRGDGLGPRQPEVGQLELALAGDEEVLRLHVAVEDAPRVAVRQPAQQLEHEHLEVAGREAAGAVALQVLGEVRAEELEHEGEAGAGVDDVVQRHDVGVPQLLQQTRLADGGEGCALLLLQPDLLERHHLVGEVAEAAEHGGVAALAQLLQLDVRLQLPVRRVAAEGRVSLALAAVLVVSVQEHLGLGPLRLLGPHDDLGHHLLLDLLVQES